MPYTLTKMDITALRKGDDLCVHLTPFTGPLVRVIKRKPMFGTDPYATDIEHLIPADVVIARAIDTENPPKCFAMVSFYHSQFTQASTNVKSLRVGDEITFRFSPDGVSNGYTKEAGLHADALYMDVRRKGNTHAHYLMATSICPENSARMCQGAVVRSPIYP
jgi:hypothetical protein